MKRVPADLAVMVAGNRMARLRGLDVLLSSQEASGSILHPYANCPHKFSWFSSVCCVALRVYIVNG